MGRIASVRGRAPIWLFPALLALVALAPGRARAQSQGFIRVTDPPGWEAGQAYAIQSGTQLHVAGVTSQPSGVNRVFINGKPARTQVDPGAPGLVHFEIVLVPEASTREVTIVVEPRTGAAIVRRYAVAVRPPGELARASATGPSQAAPRPDSGLAGREIPTLPEVHLYLRPAPPSPWRPYTFRSIGYLGLVGAGVYLTTVKKSSNDELCTGPAGRQDCVDRTVVSRPNAPIGVGVAAGAALVGLLDAVLTSRRAHARQARQVGEAPPGRTHLELPAIQPDRRGAHLELVRLRF